MVVRGAGAGIPIPSNSAVAADSKGRVYAIESGPCSGGKPGTAHVLDQSLKEIWQGETFNWYRAMHLEGRGAECWPCRGCSAWLAGIRDWHHGWLKVLKRSGDHVQEIMKKDLGVEVAVYQPAAVSQIE